MSNLDKITGLITNKDLCLINKTFDDDILDSDSQAILDQNYKYFLEYNKLYEAHIILDNQLNCLVKERNTLKTALQKLESKKKKIGGEKIIINDTYTNKKRKRRTKCEIKRNFKCNFENCKKSYGSEGSLNQHLKLKHNKLTL